LAVGIQVPEDLAGAVAEDAVYRNRSGARLKEIYDLIGGDVEALPIDRKIVAALPNVRGVARLGDSRGRGNLPSARRAECGE
jgi:hypothetical protein